ncbi:putative leucyl-tRNA synthetase [Monocercomonoides exilis]|uniref:putative leucyl-tRNA synthetase n=1 Tax=Monocercomonoides exilis TaxID=2049356 RepID=UPI00355A0E54|nr:putative leucyl-tRNA synthetase [Monocercomonoides exilis]|eukprot:MONOS_2389.1-p1 / transcript=MONOS_2389.1 / gene=MONOS_2389 / organism=Monocercomonoides_exilis_PA203 / gene_product=leucyl-tRNA synthetase / transcript_product=leucyl-tRNA synthetase / location=Mono_scaffold00049:52875-57164(+) / protein_length=1355 / sequence_SO=supercontig / SO=protein_coding / is_pseudo=false
MEEKSSTKRLDTLKDIENNVKNIWETEKTFEVAAPTELKEPKRKFMVTFPFAYMNGLLHLGHAFTFSKSDFAAGYWAEKGYDVLYPMAFHCTGMPISASAEKLKREIASGNTEIKPVAPEPTEEKEDASNKKVKGKSNKSKANAKTVANVPQFQILKMMGIPEEEVPKFQDSLHWVNYFPPIGMNDLKFYGSMTDWRRTFVTTDVNPYFDSFVKWQFTRLHEMGLIKFGKRPSVYSITDQQPCADHDRASGEGVVPQEYTIIKMRMLKDRLPAAFECLKNETEEIFFGAATLRPETMYGQTNCWVGLKVKYGAYRLKKGEGIIVCTERAALNLAHQLHTDEFGKVECLATAMGSDLVGCELQTCLSPMKIVRALPYAGVNEMKGTGVVTSVPSDAPDDWWGLEELKTKPELCEKWGVKEEWVKDIQPIEIIEVEMKDSGLMDMKDEEKDEEGKAEKQESTQQVRKTHMIARDYCEEIKKIIEAKGAGNLPELKQKAKEESYQRSFYTGVICVDGPYKGKRITEAKDQVRKMLLDSGDAMVYYEPEKPVISRSGDSCVVAMCDQWYLDYGNPEWKKKVHAALEHCNVFFPEVKKTFEHTIDWLREWGCSRQFGLGTRLPWDETVLIESLSDSTIYNAYYTICHLLQGDMYGSKPGELGITADKLTPDVWDFIFCRTNTTPAAAQADKEFEEKLLRCRKEFEYWYPVDVRVSGKDLIRNHLTFYLFNHTAMFEEKFWPKGIRPNGHLLLNQEKMSKSTGNFLTLREAIEKFSASAVRLALADAGDSWDDANFKTSNANTATLKLTKELTWIEETVAALGGKDVFAKQNHACLLPEFVTKELSFFEKLFDARMNAAVREADRAFGQMMFREGVTRGYNFIVDARDKCRDLTDGKIHPELLKKYIETSVLLITPICRHYAEHIWRNVLGKERTVTQGTWPAIPNTAEAEAADKKVIEEGEFFTDTLREARLAVQKFVQPKKPKGTAGGQKKGGAGAGKGGKKNEKKEEEKKEEEKKEVAEEKKVEKPEVKFPSAINCTIFVRDEYFQWQRVVMEILRLLFPNSAALNAANTPSACSCPACTAAVSNVGDDDSASSSSSPSSSSSSSSSDEPPVECTKQPPAFQLFSKITKALRFAHQHHNIPSQLRTAIDKYEKRLCSEFGVKESSSASASSQTLSDNIADALFRLSEAIIAAKSGGKATHIEASAETEGATPAELKARSQTWNGLVGEVLRFGVFTIERAVEAHSLGIFDDTPLFKESSVLTQNVTAVIQALSAVIAVAEKQAGLVSSAATSNVAVSVDVRPVPPTLTEDELSAPAAKQPSQETASSSSTPSESSQLPVVALRSAPTKPKFSFTSSD